MATEDTNSSTSPRAAERSSMTNEELLDAFEKAALNYAEVDDRPDSWQYAGQAEAEADELRSLILSRMSDE